MRDSPTLGSSRKVLIRFLAAVFLICSAPGLPNEPASRSEAALEFIVNEAVPGPVLLALRDADGTLWLAEEDFASLRLLVPEGQGVRQESRRYLPIRAIEGASVEVDEVMQQVHLRVPPQSFKPTALSAASGGHVQVTRAAPGAFLNYQLAARHAGDWTEGAAVELGWFGSRGVFTNTATAHRDAQALRAVRLESTLTRDFPQAMITLSLGDAVGDPGSYGNAVRFGGLRLARNFGLRPDLVTMPLLTSSGTAAVPSTIEVFVNGQLVSAQQVPPGPFSIDRLPVVSGSGEVNVVVRDALGREHVTSSSFYASNALLARGLSQFAVDVGSLRENFGVRSTDYGQAIAQGTYRRGMTDALTLEGHAELGSDGVRNLGLNAAFKLRRFGVLSFTGATGGDEAAAGWLTGAGFERRGTRSSFVVNHQWSSDDYRQLGDFLASTARVRSRTLVQSGLSFGRAGSLGLAFARQAYFESETRQTLALNHSVNLAGRGMLSLIATRSLGDDALTGAYLIYTLPLEQRRTFSSSIVSTDDLDRVAAIGTFIQNADAGASTGFRVSASTASDYELAYQRRFDAGELEVQAARYGGDAAHAAHLGGAVTLLDGEWSAARSVTGSFAIVDVGDLPDVPIYLENQPVARTNARGRALLPELRPYEPNRVGIDPRDLPLETQIVASEMTLAPPYRSGVIARFPVERIRSGTFRLRRRDGSAVPAGAWVDFNGSRFPVALDGLVYVTNFDHGLSASASWKGGACRFRIAPPPPNEPVPDMGAIVCRDLPTLVDTLPR